MNESKTLANIISRTTQQGTGVEGVSPSLNAYLIMFGINSVFRFPEVPNLNTLDYETVRKIGEFSLGFSTIGLEVWTEMTSHTENRQNMLRPSARSA